MTAEKGNGSRDSAVVQRMRQRGYVPTAEAAARVGVHLQAKALQDELRGKNALE